MPNPKESFDLDFVPGEKAIGFLRQNSVIHSSASESVGYMARDMVHEFGKGRTLKEFTEEAYQSINENTHGSYRQVELLAVNYLVNGVLQAEGRIGKDEKYDITGVYENNKATINRSMPVEIDNSELSNKQKPAKEQARMF